MKTHYRAVFISDLHLGMNRSRVATLEAFLHGIKTERIYLVGDFFDFWHLRTHKGWSQECNHFMKRLFKMVDKGTEIVLLPGNHDVIFYMFDGFHFGNMQICGEITHTTLTGKKLTVIHGDRFDMVVGRSHTVSLIVNCLYDVLMGVWGIRHLIAGLKDRVDIVIKHLSDYEKKAIAYAKAGKNDGIICGHSHTPEIKTIDGLLYCNCGDLVEHATVIVETDAGEMKLLSI